METADMAMVMAVTGDIPVVGVTGGPGVVGHVISKLWSYVFMMLGKELDIYFVHLYMIWRVSTLIKYSESLLSTDIQLNHFQKHHFLH